MMASLLFTVQLLTAAPLSIAPTRPYHIVAVKDLATSRHTHVEVVGTVTLVKKEAVGDWHIRISDGTHFIVAEIIPTLAFTDIRRIYVGGRGASGFQVPSVGDRVRVRGIRLIDNEAGHGWAEVHPVEELMVVR